MRKILMFLSTWGSEFSKSLIEGIKERLEKEGENYELHICNAYDDWIFHPIYKKDNEIFSLVNPDDYDGLILSFNSVKSLAVIDEVANEFIKKDKPIVSVDKSYEGASFCGLDNYWSMYRMVEHMITIHDCRTLNYVGGYPDHEENMARFKAFGDCLKAHGIVVDPKRVVHKSFTIDDGAKAYEEFKKIDFHMPDAVICANDKMARGYSEAAIKDGILVPDYLKVTGFDETILATSYCPSITTLSRNWKQLGIDSVDTLLYQIENGRQIEMKYNEGYICFNESCGCEEARNIREDYNRLVSINSRRRALDSMQIDVREQLLGSHDFESFQNNLKAGREGLGYADVAVCINSEIADKGMIDGFEGYSDEVDIYTENDHERAKRTQRLYPDKWRESGEKVFVFSPMNYSGCTLGYTVMPYRNDFFTRATLRKFNEGVTIAVGNIVNRKG